MRPQSMGCARLRYSPIGVPHSLIAGKRGSAQRESSTASGAIRAQLIYPTDVACYEWLSSRELSLFQVLCRTETILLVAIDGKRCMPFWRMDSLLKCRKRIPVGM